MQVSDLITKIHIAYKGKGADKAPASGDAKYDVYLSRASDNVDRWAEDPSIDNPDLFGGDIEISLNDGYADLPSNAARVTDPVMYAGKEIPIVSYKDRHRLKAGAYVVGRKGYRRLYIINPSSYPDNLFTVGVVEYPPSLEYPTDEVICTNLRWLALQTAAQLAEQDPSKEDLAPSLFNQAAGEYKDTLISQKRQLRGSSPTMRTSGYVRIAGL